MIRSSSASSEKSGTISPPQLDVAAIQRDVKAGRVKAACNSRDVLQLIELATEEHGLVNDDLRKVAWPLLLGCKQSAAPRDTQWEKLPKHRDEDQVQLDVNRSFVYYPHGIRSSRSLTIALKLMTV